MTRPAVVIGLGGTGQWVLTFLKKDLIEIGNGQLPPTAHLLCFDTTSQTFAEIGYTKDGRQTDTEIKLGSIKLEHGTEFIPIGGNVYDLVRHIRTGQENPAKQEHPHIASWFDARDMINRHMRTSFNLAEGAGQVRHFGRLAVFNDLRSGLKSKIMAHLRKAIEDLRTEVSERRQLEIIIVASFSGGTGAGIFIDMGILARSIATQLVQKDLCIRGFYVLPRVFGAQNQEMQARSFGAWRELDRFLMTGETYGSRRMVYHPSIQNLQIDLTERIFDVCYLVDSIGDGKNSLDDLPPDRGLYPLVSDTISTLMDSTAGQTYTEYVTSNLAGKLDILPRAPYHSAIGAYTVKVPIYYALQVFAHRYALDVLGKFLHPIKNIEKQIITGVSSQHNQQKPGYTGRRAALEFMRATSSADFGIVGDERLAGTFTHIVADLVEREAYTDEALIQHVSRLSIGSNQLGAATTYFHGLVNLPQDERGSKILGEVNTELYLPLTKGAPPSRLTGGRPDADYTRIKTNVENFIIDHYGRPSSEGTELRGHFGDALNKCQAFQVERFREMLYLWLGATLNGTVDNVERAKGGKLGYAYIAVQDIVKSFGEFVEFFIQVRETRTERLSRLKLDAAAKRALAAYNEHKNERCWFRFLDSGIHPRAHMTQLAYLRAEDRKISERKFDILISLLMETAAAMKAIADDVVAQLGAWIDCLAVGDVERQITSLYSRLESSLDLAEGNHFHDTQLEKVQRLIGEHIYEPNPEKVEELLKRLEWKIQISEQSINRVRKLLKVTPKDGFDPRELARGLSLGLNVKVPTPDGEMEGKSFRCSGPNITDFNLRLMLSMGEAQYADLPKQSPVIKQLINTYPTPNDLADELDGMAEPLYEKNTMHSEPKAVSRFIRVDTDTLETGRQEAKEFIQAVENRLNELHPMNVDTEYTLLPSDNRYRLTVLRSDDLLLSEGFGMWHTCRKSYQNLIINQKVSAERFHIYPAERNAAYYEKEIYDVLQKAGGYRILHPAVVALLEDRSAFEYFFLSVAYGFVRQEMIDNQDVYILRLPGEKEQIYHLSHTFENIHEQRPPDLLEVVDVFVNRGSDINNERMQISITSIKRAVKDRLDDPDFGPQAVRDRLLYQLEHASGLVKSLRHQVDEAREGFEATRQQYIAIEYEDLADLAEVIYRRYLRNLPG